MNKKIILILSYLFATTSVHATVQPIRPGENICKLVARIGATADAIEQKVCGICCDYEITQNDIPFTITAPGVYCLAENVTVPTDEAGITIQSECVVLDLKGRSIDGLRQKIGSNFVRSSYGIFVDGGQIGSNPANVVVKNGVIKRTNNDGVFVQNVSQPSVRLSNLKVTDCGNLNDNGVFIKDSLGVVIQECESSMNLNNNNGFLVANSPYCVLKDCIAFGNNDLQYAQNTPQELRKSGFNIKSNFCCLLECKAFNNYFHGFMIRRGGNFLYRCMALRNGDEGFMIYLGSDKNVLSECISIKSGWSVDGHDGFDVKGGKNILRRCIASGSDDSGVDINGGAGNEVLECLAIGGRRGIDVDTSKAVNTKVFANVASSNTLWNYQSSITFKKVTPTTETTYWTNIEP